MCRWRVGCERPLICYCRCSSGWQQLYVQLGRTECRYHGPQLGCLLLRPGARDPASHLWPQVSSSSPCYNIHGLTYVCLFFQKTVWIAWWAGHVTLRGRVGCVRRGLPNHTGCVIAANSHSVNIFGPAPHWHTRAVLALHMRVWQLLV
jgi:hypothetical protein